MRNNYIMLLLCLFLLGCKNKKNNVLYIYCNYQMSKDEIFDQNNLFYSGRDITFIKDSILITSYIFDKNFNPSDKYEYVFLKRDNNLFRKDIKDNMQLFLTINNSENVFFPIVLYDPDNYLDTVYGISHRYISKTKVKNPQNKDISVYKFFVREGRVENNDTSLVGESDYYSYYTEDFVLYRKEYIGVLAAGYIQYRLEVTFDSKTIDFKKDNITQMTFGTE